MLLLGARLGTENRIETELNRVGNRIELGMPNFS